MATVDITSRLGIAAVLDTIKATITFEDTVGMQTERTVGELAQKDVLFDGHDAAASEEVVTRLYRLINDQQVLAYQGLPAEEATRGLKFDVTVVPPSSAVPSLGQEYPKTVGHFHTSLPGSAVASPDFYQVVHGRGHLLLQAKYDTVVQPYLISVGPGDIVLVPPWLAHISINTGPDVLVFSNVCVRQPHLDYESITSNQGGAYYVVRTGDGMAVIPNPRYALHGYAVCQLTHMVPNQEALMPVGVPGGSSIYDCLVTNAPILRALSEPDAWLGLFDQALRPVNDQF